MAWRKLWTIAYRDLLRNRRRSLLTLLAVALGYALLMLLNGFVAGILEDSLQNSIRLQTGHVQIRNTAYEVEKLSLHWADLLEDPGALAARAEAMAEVKAAAPVLWASGILSTIDDTAGLRLYGIDTASPLYDPIREAMVAGDYLTAEDRSGILIGRRLADDLGIGVGQNVNLSVVDADGRLDEGIFTIRGLFSTGIFTYDDGRRLPAAVQGPGLHRRRGPGQRRRPAAEPTGRRRVGGRRPAGAGCDGPHLAGSEQPAPADHRDRA